jgi:hypothetical protein
MLLAGLQPWFLSGLNNPTTLLDNGTSCPQTSSFSSQCVIQAWPVLSPPLYGTVMLHCSLQPLLMHSCQAPSLRKGLVPSGATSCISALDVPLHWFGFSTADGFRSFPHLNPTGGESQSYFPLPRLCYPEGNFGRNQLLEGSISLSPLYSSSTIDLHVRIATSLHQGFLWLHPTQAYFTIFWVPACMLHLRTITKGLVQASVPSMTEVPTFHFHFASGFTTQTLAGMIDSLVRVSRRVA